VLLSEDAEFEKFFFKYIQLVVAEIVQKHVDTRRNPKHWSLRAAMDEMRMQCMDANPLLVSTDFNPTPEDVHTYAASSPILFEIKEEDVLRSLLDGSPLPPQVLPQFDHIAHNWEANRDRAVRIMQAFEGPSTASQGLFAFGKKRNELRAKVLELYFTEALIQMFYAHREGMQATFPTIQQSDIMKAMKIMSVQILGTLWEDHLALMTTLRSTTNLRSFGLMSPFEEYEIDGSRAFEAMVGEARRQIVNKTFFLGAIEQEKSPNVESTPSDGVEDDESLEKQLNDSSRSQNLEGPEWG